MVRPIQQSGCAHRFVSLVRGAPRRVRGSRDGGDPPRRLGSESAGCAQGGSFVRNEGGRAQGVGELSLGRRGRCRPVTPRATSLKLALGPASGTVGEHGPLVQWRVASLACAAIDGYPCSPRCCVGSWDCSKPFRRPRSQRGEKRRPGAPPKSHWAQDMLKRSLPLRAVRGSLPGTGAHRPQAGSRPLPVPGRPGARGDHREPGWNRPTTWWSWPCGQGDGGEGLARLQKRTGKRGVRGVRERALHQGCTLAEGSGSGEWSRSWRSWKSSPAAASAIRRSKLVLPSPTLPCQRQRRPPDGPWRWVANQLPPAIRLENMR